MEKVKLFTMQNAKTLRQLEPREGSEVVSPATGMLFEGQVRDRLVVK